MILIFYVLERFVGTLVIENRIKRINNYNTSGKRYYVFYVSCCYLGSLVLPFIFLLKQNKNIKLYLILSSIALIWKGYKIFIKHIKLSKREIEMLIMFIISIFLLSGFPSIKAKKISKNEWSNIIIKNYPISNLVNMKNSSNSSHNIVCIAMGFPGKKKWIPWSPFYWGHDFLIAQSQDKIITAGNTGKCNKNKIENDNLMFNSKNIPHNLTIDLKRCEYINKNKLNNLILYFKETYKVEYCEKYSLLENNCVHWIINIFKKLGFKINLILPIPIFNYPKNDEL